MQELMKRSEAIERAAWTDLYRRAPGRLRRRLGLQAMDHGGMTFLSASRVEHLLLNRAVGLGSSPFRGQAAAAVRHFERRGIGRYWIHLGSQFRYSELPAELKTHGVVPYPRSWMKFVRRAAPVDRSDCELRVRPAEPTDAKRVAEVLAPSFDLPAEAAPVLSSGIGCEGWHYFVAEDGPRIVAAGALYTKGKDAILAFAGTAPEARRKGCQQALVAERLEQAQRLGCTHTFTETGVPVGGDPSSSYRNILRAGFDELYVRDNFAPEGARWQSQSSSDAIANSAGSPMRSTSLLRDTAPSGT